MKGVRYTDSDRPVGLVDKACIWTVVDLDSIPAVAVGIFQGR